jgi:hypothetical protein
MAFGNNRAQKQSRAHFQLAGGSIIKFRHPYLAGQIDTEGEGKTGTTAIDEIDVSASCKLEGRFFEARQNQDSAKQVVLVDGSTVTISNKLLNGTITMPVVKGTGLVAEGDFIAALQLIRTLGDSVGGLLYKTDYINGKAITKLYYGVTPQSVPDDISEGNDVPVYDVKLLYAGWIEAVSTSTDENKKRIWAVGNQQGLEAYFSPYVIQDGSTGTTALSALNSGMAMSKLADQIDDTNYNTLDGTTEAKVLSEGWKSNDTVIVGDASVIGSTVQKTNNSGQNTETKPEPAEG